MQFIAERSVAKNTCSNGMLIAVEVWFGAVERVESSGVIDPNEIE